MPEQLCPQKEVGLPKPGKLESKGPFQRKEQSSAPAECESDIARSSVFQEEKCYMGDLPIFKCGQPIDTEQECHISSK